MSGELFGITRKHIVRPGHQKMLRKHENAKFVGNQLGIESFCNYGGCWGERMM